jgi:hypothetical protein
MAQAETAGPARVRDAYSSDETDPPSYSAMSPPSFSERERGRPPRATEEIDSRAWGGLAAIVSQHLAQNDFAHDFPVGCHDLSSNVVATDEQLLALAFRDVVVGVHWPLWPPTIPEPSAVMDMIEFFARHAAKAEKRSRGWHPFYGHHHLDFDVQAGRTSFADDINDWCGRHGLAYEIGPDLLVRRLAPPVVRERLVASEFDTGDSILDGLLESAKKKYAQPDPRLRVEALKELWDAWERLKSSRIPERAKKKQSSEQLLEEAAARSPALLAAISADALALTSIGNEYAIRHSEVDTVPIEDPEHVDYLFGRLFNLIYLVVRSRRPRPNE